MRREPIAREQVVETLRSTEGLQEVAFTFGGADDTFAHHDDSDRVGFILADKEYELQEPAFVKACRMVGVAETVLGKFPKRLITPLLNHWFSQRNGDMKCLLNRDDQVVAFTKVGIQYVSNIQILEAVEHALNAKFGNGLPLQYHNVYNDLAETQFAVVTPRSEHQAKRGDFLNFGIQVQNSIVGEKPVVVSAYVYRLACTNGAISADNVFTFSRRIRGQTLPSWVEDACTFAADKAAEEFERLTVLARTPVTSHGGHIIQGLFQEHSLPKELRELIATSLVDSGAETLYDIYNAITAVANHTEATPAQIRHLQMAAGHLAKYHEFCPSCHRTLMNN